MTFFAINHHQFKKYNLSYVLLIYTNKLTQGYKNLLFPFRQVENPIKVKQKSVIFCGVFQGILFHKRDHMINSAEYFDIAFCSEVLPNYLIATKKNRSLRKGI